jgi:hypothetical protein
MDCVVESLPLRALFERADRGREPTAVVIDDAVELAQQRGCLLVGQIKVHAPQTGALTFPPSPPLEDLGHVRFGKTKVDTFQFCGPHELWQLKCRYVSGNQPHEGPRKSRSVVARFVDVAGYAVRDLVQQDGRLDAVPRDPNAQPVRGGDASGGGFRYFGRDSGWPYSLPRLGWAGPWRTANRALIPRLMWRMRSRDSIRKSPGSCEVSSLERLAELQRVERDKILKFCNQDQNVPCFRERDREFESISLQRRVRSEPGSR